MGYLVFDGCLNKKEYSKLWLKKRKKYLFTFILLFIFELISAALFTATFFIDLKDIVTIASFYTTIVLFIGLVIMFILTFPKGSVPCGDVKVYKNDSSLYIVWLNHKKSVAKTLKINKKETVDNYLYVEESRRNFVYLPGNIYF